MKELDLSHNRISCLPYKPDNMAASIQRKDLSNIDQVVRASISTIFTRRHTPAHLHVLSPAYRTMLSSISAPILSPQKQPRNMAPRLTVAQPISSLPVHHPSVYGPNRFVHAASHTTIQTHPPAALVTMHLSVCLSI